MSNYKNAPVINNKVSPSNLEILKYHEIDPQAEGEDLQFTWMLGGNVISNDKVLTIKKSTCENVEIYLRISNKFGEAQHKYEFEIVDAPVIQISYGNKVEYKLVTGAKNIEHIKWFFDGIIVGRKKSVFVKEKFDGEVVAEIALSTGIIRVNMPTKVEELVVESETKVEELAVESETKVETKVESKPVVKKRKYNKKSKPDVDTEV